mgnify:CR=1 FL=1
MQAISNGIGTGQIVSTEIDQVIDEDWVEYFNVNIKMKTSAIMNDIPAPDDAEDQEAAAKAGKFPWHCEKGIL